LFTRALPGAAVWEVSGSGFSGELGVVVVPLGENGAWGEPGYQLQLHGQGLGNVELAVEVVQPDGRVWRLPQRSFATAPGSLALLRLAPGGGSAELWAGENGDGVVERQEVLQAEAASVPPPRLLSARLDTALDGSNHTVSMLESPAKSGQA
jgi:hypothetical protein